VRVRVPDLCADGVDQVPGAGPELAPPAGDAPVAGGYRVAVRLTGAPGGVRDPLIRALFDETVADLTSGRVVYQSVPEPLRARPETAWRLGMADCVVAARVLAGRARGLGLPARARRGYLLGLVGSDHAWCEVYEDGVWRPLDAVFAFVAAGGGGRDLAAKAPGFAGACCGGRFNRLLPCVADNAAPLVYVGDEAPPPWSLAGVSAQPWGRP
jgi:hypothetical protein